MRDSRFVGTKPHYGAAVFALVAGLTVAGALGYALSRDALSMSDPDSPMTRAADLPEAPTPLPELLHSKWYTQSLDPIIDVGQTADILVQFRNAGHTPWIRGTAAELRLGAVGPDPLPPRMRVDWPYWDRPARQLEALVREGGLATFTFRVKGIAPGTFRVWLRPVVDGVTWLEDDHVTVDITVRAVQGSGGRR